MIIKVRAWDTRRKKMWSAEEMGSDELSLNPDGRGFCNPNPRDTCLTTYMTWMIPLLYTGRADKNDQEIYEGDILRNTPYSTDKSCTGEMYEVKFGEYDDSEIDYGSPGLGFYCESKLGDQQSIVNLPGSIEVIGNVYESPDWQSLQA